jgi:hypothetical protein
MLNLAYNKTIALLFHELDTQASIQNYLITYYANIWQQKGSRIIVLFGARRFVAADLIIVHVDLSVVPDNYLEFAARYPIVLNGQVRDIRKSRISKNLLSPDTEYQGAVIVKSDNNYAGMPERRMLPAKSPDAEHPFKNPLDYQIYPSYAAIPDAIVQLQSIVVEKFLPEIEQGLYHIRFYNFLGKRGNCMRVASPHPIVHIYHAVKIEQIPFDPRLEELRRAHNFDYGKFDYVQRDGEIILFDTNKTTGFVGATDDPTWREARYFRAMGIYEYFDR